MAEVLSDIDPLDELEDTPVLALPQPLPPPSFVPGAIQPLLVPWADQIRDLTTLPRRYFIRGFKSILLLLKVRFPFLAPANNVLILLFSRRS